MSSTVFTPALSRINLGAIQRNFARLGPSDKLMPVVKSDAYGHGLLPVAQAIANAGAKRFAVGLASEGAALRESGFKQDIILLMGCLSHADWQLAIKHRLTPIIGTAADAQAAENACGSSTTLQVAVKCDTGMGRLGFAPEEADAVAELLRAAPHLRPRLVISHLACADMPDSTAYTQKQIALFHIFYERMAASFPGISRSLGNSAATLDSLDDDISRPGLAIYGGNPFGPDPCGLEWAMSFSAPIVQVHSLARGQSVSYGRIFTAPADMRVAVVACGYASGYGRNLSNRARVMVHGRSCRQIGRICMSMSMVDVTNVPAAQAGDTVWLLGGEAAPGEHPVDAWELATLLDTIPYEILCLFGGLTPRMYVNA